MKPLLRRLRPVAVSVVRAAKALGYRPPERIFRHLHFQGPFTLSLPSGANLRLNSWGNRVENELAWRGWDGHEPVERARWLALVQEGGCVFDIGANTGTFAFMAKAVRPDASVTAFEPVDRIADRLALNTAVSGLDVTLVRVAVSSQPGTLPIFDPGGANAYSASLEADFLDAQTLRYDVPVVSIDSYVSQHGRAPRTIKMDIEGSEGRALLGARATLGKGQVRVLCEWLGKSDSHRDAVTMLHDAGYAAMDLRSLDPFDLGANVASHAERNILIAHHLELARLRRLWRPMP